MAPSSTRARALGLARRLAAGALQRIAREVDRLSVALEPLRSVLPLHEPVRAAELEVTRNAAPRAPTASPSAPPSPPPQTTSEEPSAIAAHPPAPAPAPAPASEPPSTAPSRDPPPSEAADVLPLVMKQVLHLRSALDPQLARLRAATAWEQAEDPTEALHDVRVASRRLRAFVRLFAPMIGNKRTRKLERRLRAITRALGPVREHDVLLAGLGARHHDAEPLARAALEHVTAWAKAQRRKAVRRAHDAIAEADVVALATAIEGELDGVCGRLLRHDDHLPERASVLLEPELVRAFEGMPRPRDETDLEPLHDVRIRAKRLRYALDLLQPTLAELHGSLRSPLKRVQSTIGEHRDAAQLAARLHERGTALAAEGLHTLAGALAPVEAVALRRRQRAFVHVMRALEGLDASKGGSGGPLPRAPT